MPLFPYTVAALSLWEPPRSPLIPSFQRARVLRQDTPVVNKGKEANANGALGGYIVYYGAINQC